MTNVVVVKGRLTRPVGEKVLPSGDRLAVVELTVPGPAPAEGGAARAESVPASWLGAPAWLLDLEPGAEVVLVGRIRRRFFHAAGLQSRTEVVVEAGAPARRPGKVTELVRGVAERLTDATDPGPTPRRRRTKAAPTFP